MAEPQPVIAAYVMGQEDTARQRGQPNLPGQGWAMVIDRR
jgi:hypothetical protein